MSFSVQSALTRLYTTIERTDDRNRRSAASFKRAILCGLFFALNLMKPDQVRASEPAELSRSESAIAFAPTDDQYIDYGESSFSVPRPIIVLGPFVLGSAEEYPANTTVEQIGPHMLKVRIIGRVYDFLANMVADHEAEFNWSYTASE